MVSSRGKRSRTEPQVEQKEIKVGHKYECRFNNDPDEKMVSCITKEKKPDGTWLVQYSGKPTQVIVDESNISATNGNVMVHLREPLKKQLNLRTKPMRLKQLFSRTFLLLLRLKTQLSLRLHKRSRHVRGRM